MDEKAVCEACFSGRPAVSRIEYNHMGICWVCWVRMHAPLWAQHVIDFLDRKGRAPQ